MCVCLFNKRLLTYLLTYLLTSNVAKHKNIISDETVDNNSLHSA